jgi:CheY-like chemotaxis protein
MDLVKLMGRRVSVILERRMAQEEIINAKLIAEDASNAKSSFLANMSHEIRTPLTAIIGFGESLLDSQQNMEQRIGSIKTIIRSGKHLLQVINDILDLSKVEARKLDVEEIDFLLFPILAEIDSLVRKQAKDSGLEFTIQYNFPLPKMIKSEPLRLKQILINLLNNAIKFTEAGSVTLIVDCDREKEKLHFKVVDTGIGLSISQIEKIFNPFSQADISTSRRFGGTGLGLSLSKQLVERLGGSLTVESQEGRGSTFQFSMDVGDLSGRDFVTSMEEVLVDTSPKLSSPSLQKMSGSILLAEDNTDNQVLISMYLESMGADVTIVSNGQAAVEAARNKIYDLILMDMQMPIMDGLEAVSLLRSQDYDYPIAALTANAMKEDKERCLQMGCNDFITKPVNRGDLCEVVGKYLLKSEISDATESAKIVPLISIMLESDPDFMSILGGFVKNLGVSINELRQADQDKRWDDLKFIVHQIKGLGGGYGGRGDICQASLNIVDLWLRRTTGVQNAY